MQRRVPRLALQLWGPLRQLRRSARCRSTRTFSCGVCRTSTCGGHSRLPPQGDPVGSAVTRGGRIDRGARSIGSAVGAELFSRAAIAAWAEASSFRLAARRLAIARVLSRVPGPGSCGSTPFCRTDEEMLKSPSPEPRRFAPRDQWVLEEGATRTGGRRLTNTATASCWLRLIWLQQRPAASRPILPA